MTKLSKRRLRGKTLSLSFKMEKQTTLAGMSNNIPKRIKLLEKRANIEIGHKNMGTVYLADVEGRHKKVYITRRNPNLVYNNKNSIGLSQAAINRIKNHHKTDIVLINYVTDAHEYYYYTRLKDWINSDIDIWYGKDLQKHIKHNILKINEIEVIPL